MRCSAIKMIVICLIALTCIPAARASDQVDWNHFKSTHGLSFETISEDFDRFRIFEENEILASERNAAEEGTAKFGTNKFSYLTEEEFRKTYLMDPQLAQKLRRASGRRIDVPTRVVPAQWDWRDHNAVTGVKNQGPCGSCWAFSTVGNVESLYAVKAKKLLSLSEQQIVDCCTDMKGCSGGIPYNAIKDLAKLGGLETEQGYNYSATQGKCKFQKAKIAVAVSGVVALPKNETAMEVYLYENGGISVALNAAASLIHYVKGIIKLSHEKCDPARLDHAVLLVGYGSDGGVPFWIVKNSWGANWGENGYFRIFRGGNTCGIANNVVSAVIE